MFSLPSFSKILLLVAIIIAVWYGFKLLGQFDRQRKALAREREGKKPARRAANAEEMVHCQTCGTYMPASATACGKVDCPF